MAIDVNREKLLTFNEVAEQLFASWRPDAATWFRWATKGLRGVRLETVKVGGKVLTSREAVHRFVAATNGTCSLASAPTSNLAKPSRSANEVLRVAGIAADYSENDRDACRVDR
ncbi:MAG: DUF1580 domain-containing protein [Pirellulales bacterium]|nr:DUF1580 domain-containing protein [Pirellulales bacterium]